MAKLTQAEIDRQDAWAHHCATTKPTLQDAINYGSIENRTGRLMYHFVNQTDAYKLSCEIRELPYCDTIVYRKVENGVLGLYDIIRDENNVPLLFNRKKLLTDFLKEWGIQLKLNFACMEKENDPLYQKWVLGIDPRANKPVLLSKDGKPIESEPPQNKIPPRYQNAELKMPSLSGLVLHYPWIIENNKEWFEGVLDELRKEKASAPATA